MTNSSNRAATALSEGLRWHVCHTKPRCEKKFAALMVAERLVYYLPLLNSVRRYGTQVKRFTKPLFPSYVFAQVVLERRARIYQQDLLVRAIPVEDETTFLRQLEDVRTIVTSGMDLSLHPLLKKGTRVKVIYGPLKGTEGFVDDPAHPQGVVVAMDVLQQGVLVRLPMDQLHIVP